MTTRVQTQDVRFNNSSVFRWVPSARRGWPWGTFRTRTQSHTLSEVAAQFFKLPEFFAPVRAGETEYFLRAIIKRSRRRGKPPGEVREGPPGNGLFEQVHDACSIPGSWIICMPLFGLLHAHFGNGQVPAYLSCKPVGYFSVSRYCFAVPRFRVAPKRMFTAFSFQVASMFTKVSQQRCPLHWITTTS